MCHNYLLPHTYDCVCVYVCECELKRQQKFTNLGLSSSTFSMLHLLQLNKINVFNNILLEKAQCHSNTYFQKFSTSYLFENLCQIKDAVLFKHFLVLVIILTMKVLSVDNLITRDLF